MSEDVARMPVCQAHGAQESGRYSDDQENSAHRAPRNDAALWPRPPRASPQMGAAIVFQQILIVVAMPRGACLLPLGHARSKSRADIALQAGRLQYPR